MKEIKVRIDDADYDHVISHFAKDYDERMGSPLVAVRAFRGDVEPAPKSNPMNGLQVHDSQWAGAKYIALPKQLQTPCGGGCKCDWCIAAKEKDPGYVPMWDTLAIATKARKDRNEQYTWTVHMPELHLTGRLHFVERQNKQAEKCEICKVQKFKHDDDIRHTFMPRAGLPA